MVDPRLAELIQADIDGELAGPEKAELGRALLADPQARRLHDALRRTDHILRSAEPAEPPPGLRESVLNSIFGPAGADAADITPRTSGGRGRPAFLRYAAVFLGGLFVASMAFYLAGPDGTTDPRDLAGTMSAGPAPGRLISETPLRAGDSEASVRLYRSGKTLVLEATVSGGAGSGLEIAYDDEILRLTDVYRAATDWNARIGPDRLRVGPQAGPQRVYFEGPEAGAVQLDVALQSADGAEDRRTLGAPARR